jgi:hypothetical protein
MGTLKKDFKYKIIKNFLTTEELKLIKEYCIIKHRNNRTQFDFGLLKSDGQEKQVVKNGDSFFDYDPLTESLLMYKLNLMEKETNLKLFPTYSFWRLYTYDANLVKHKDRPSCEVSVTVQVGSDGTKWPIYIDGNKIELEDGDAALYLGCELEHWRETFEGDWQAQIFMHYVDVEGPYYEFRGDKRRFLGEIKNEF